MVLSGMIFGLAGGYSSTGSHSAMMMMMILVQLLRVIRQMPIPKDNDSHTNLLEVSIFW
jgi:hypothetical protein